MLNDNNVKIECNQQLRIPGWHFTMLNDHQRNEAFYNALSLYINNDIVVLDIGAGCGLLSMIAATLGAKHVFAIERDYNLSKCLKEVIEQNNLNDKITIINKVSYDIVLGLDIPERADLIVTETFDCGLIGEGCLQTISHAKQNFLKPNGTILPKKGKMLATVIESSELRYHYMITSHILDFNLFNFNKLRKQGEELKLCNINSYKELTYTSTIREFDFNNKFLTLFHDTINLTLNRSGYIDSVVIWFKLHITNNIILENSPSNNLHWNQWFLFPNTTLKGNKGDILQIDVNNTSGYFEATKWSILKKSQRNV